MAKTVPRNISTFKNKACLKAKYPRFAPNPNFKLELRFATAFDVIYLPVADTIVVLDKDSIVHRVATLSGHFNDVNCCLFNNTCQELLSGGSDRNILLWHPNDQQTRAYDDHLKQGGSRGGDGSKKDDVRDYWSSSSSEEEEDS